MPTPGILYAAGRITSPDLSPAAFDEWYNTVHIPEVLRIPSGPPRAYRFHNTATTTKTPTTPTETQTPPYLALYTVSDLSIVSSPHFANLSQTHPLLPNNQPYLALTAFDVRVYATVQAYERTPTNPSSSSSGTPQAPTHTHTLALAPSSSSTSPAQLDQWYQSQHRALAARIPSYTRSTRYSLVAAPLANARPRGEGEAVPSELVVLEFVAEKDGIPALDELDAIVRGAEGGDALLSGAGVVEADSWKLVFEERKEVFDQESGKA